MHCLNSEHQIFGDFFSFLFFLLIPCLILMWSENILFMISVFKSDETYFQLQYKVNFINYIYELENNSYSEGLGSSDSYITFVNHVFQVLCMSIDFFFFLLLITSVNVFKIFCDCGFAYFFFKFVKFFIYIF